MQRENSFTPITSGLLITAVDQDGIKQLFKESIAEALAEIGTKTPQDLQFVSQQELAKILGLCVPTVIEMRKKGRIPAVQVGNKWKYEVGEVWEALRATKYGRKK